MRHFTLLLLSVFTVYQAKADILIPLDKYPTGEKRFNLQINGSHDTSTPWLSTTSFGVDEDGQMGNPENWTSEQIDEDNHSVSHRLIMNSISLRLSYRVWDNLSLWAGIGTTNFTHEETFRDDDDLSSWQNFGDCEFRIPFKNKLYSLDLEEVKTLMRGEEVDKKELTIKLNLVKIMLWNLIIWFT